MLIGTNDNQNLQFETNGSVRMTISGSTGFTGLGTGTPSGVLHISNSGANTFLRLQNPATTIMQAAGTTTNSGSVVFFGISPTSGYDIDVQTTGATNGGSVRIAGNSTIWQFGNVSSVSRTGTGNQEMFNIVMGGSSITQPNQNPLRVQFNSSQGGSAGYVALRVNATHTTVGTGLKLLQTWEFTGATQSAMDISGSLGLGITSPTARLHLSSSTNTSVLLRADSPTLSNILFVTGSGRVGIGTDTPSELFSVIKNGNSKILAGDNVSIQTSAVDQWIYLFSDPSAGKYLNIDATQDSNPPPRYLPAVPAKEIYGQNADDFALGTPDYWMEIKLNGIVVLIPCYIPN
jgi:hypothetical protein